MNQNTSNPAIKILNEKSAVRLAEIFAALADPTRLRIISALAHHELNVGELAQLVGMTDSATSHQLRLLRTQRIVGTRKQDDRCFIRWMINTYMIYWIVA